jgi:hypothetical protein
MHALRAVSEACKLASLCKNARDKLFKGAVGAKMSAKLLLQKRKNTFCIDAIPSDGMVARMTISNKMRSRLPDLLAILVILIAGFVAIVFAAEKSGPSHSDSQFMAACATHNFTPDQCAFFRFGVDGPPKNEGIVLP